MVGRSKRQIFERNLAPFIFSYLKKAAKYGKIEYQIKSTKGGITMAAEKKKVYGNMRIMAIEGKDIFRADTLTALENGKLNPDKFDGIIDESLDTDKRCEVYKAHEAEMGYPYLADKKYCRAIVSVSFECAIKFEQTGGAFFIYQNYTAARLFA